MSTTGSGEVIIRLIAVSSSDAVVEETWIPVPDGVDAYNVQSAIEQAFGESTEPALERHETFGVMQIGWYYPGNRLSPFGLPAEGNSALVIPCITQPDGSTTPLAFANALERARLEEIFGSEHVHSFDARTEYRPPDPETTD